MSPTSQKKTAGRARHALPAPGRRTSPGQPSFGIALGGGGARGLCHALMLEAFDELGIRPVVIAGTSIGALMGSAYASGMSGAEMIAHCRELFQTRTELVKRLLGRLNVNGGLAGMLNGSPFPVFSGEGILEALLPDTIAPTFEDLEIPFLAVTADFYTQSPRILSEGPLITAVAASCALPGLLKPIETGGRVLIDGGFVNPLPFDLLKGAADIIAAVDVSAGPQRHGKRLPTLVETVLGSTQIALATLVREKLKAGAPDILIRPKVGHFRVLDFYRLDEILAAAEPAKDEFKRACETAVAQCEKLAQGETG
jgi:NTE family protein